MINYFITGFVDAEGCFMVAVKKNSKSLIGYAVHVAFQIELHKNDRAAAPGGEAPALGGVCIPPPPWGGKNAIL
jgi:hypothetical protein